MGADYYSYSVVGIEIDEKKLYLPPKKVKAFKHDYPESMKFSPDNGKPLWDTEEQPVPGYDPDDEKLGKYRIYHGTDHSVAVVGIGVEAGGYKKQYDFMKLGNTDKLKNELEDFLTPLGLWDKDKFGLYSICYCSY